MHPILPICVRFSNHIRFCTFIDHPDDGSRLSLEISSIDSTHGHDILLHLHDPALGINGQIIRLGLNVRSVVPRVIDPEHPTYKLLVSFSGAVIRTGSGAYLHSLQHVRLLTEHEPDHLFTPVLITTSAGFADEREINPDTPSPVPPVRPHAPRNPRPSSPAREDTADPAPTSGSSSNTSTSGGARFVSTPQRPPKRQRVPRLPLSSSPIFDSDPPPKRSRVSIKVEPNDYIAIREENPSLSTTTARQAASGNAPGNAESGISPKHRCIVKPRPRCRVPNITAVGDRASDLVRSITEGIQRQHAEALEAAAHQGSDSSDPSWAQLDEAGLITPGPTPPPAVLSPDPVSPLDVSQLSTASLDPQLLECYQKRVECERAQRAQNWYWLGQQVSQHPDSAPDRLQPDERPPARNRAGPPRGWRESLQSTPEQLRYVARHRRDLDVLSDSQEPCSSSQADRRDQLEAQFLVAVESSFNPPAGFITPPLAPSTQPESPVFILESPAADSDPQTPDKGL